MTCRRAACTPGCLDDHPTLPRRSPAARAAVAARSAAAIGLALIVVRVLAAGSGRTAGRRGAWALHRVSGPVLAALGVQVHTSGTPRSGAALVVGNHLSWLDILVLSAQTPMRQVAKTEVGDWPLVSGVARRTGTIFLDRFRPRALPEVVEAAALALRQGHKVQVFPEATTRCGGAVGEFYRCVFQAAIDAAVVVAPVTLRYLDIDGQPTPVPAFLGDETLIESLRRVLAVRGLVVQVHWLPPIPAVAGTGHRAVDRKRLASAAERAVARALTVPVVRRRAERPAEAGSAAGVGARRRSLAGVGAYPARRPAPTAEPSELQIVAPGC
ncbi:lysophospholipid acyltransferase family protein [Nakamurella lactea]|uniref:lysophospholipid acyltransferase family protein n=1 Tax=Nakamurella lactea TaxID=459515 RepID=UPI0012B5598D|nr:lysophospholipid acyltransferase family protein [Nakamurella lactea]